MSDAIILQTVIEILQDCLVALDKHDDEIIEKCKNTDDFKQIPWIKEDIDLAIGLLENIKCPTESKELKSIVLIIQKPNPFVKG